MEPEVANLPTTLDIPLDRSLQVWVLLPISLATLLMGLLRRNMATLTLREPETNIVKTRDANRLKRSKVLRANRATIAADQFEARRHYFVRKDGGLHMPKKERPTMSAMMNPENLANQVTGIVTNLVPHMLLGTWARYLFAGVAVCRLPFTLTPRFRNMLQSGIEMAGQNLDVSYVSSLSWYILNLFGNAGLLSLISTGDDNDIFIPSVASQIALNVTPDKVFKEERDALLKVEHQCGLDKIERSLLQLNPVVFTE